MRPHLLFCIVPGFRNMFVSEKEREGSAVCPQSPDREFMSGEPDPASAHCQGSDTANT